jgi:TetR/AcrR family transcriptional regulator, regulator of cefoperazone and chloramphenicol sensitivity
MERQDALVQAAYELLGDRGFEGLRTRDVAEKVGVNVATLHYYFPTKEKLIRGVVAYAMGRFRSTLAPAGSPGAQMRAHFAGIRALARDEPRLFAVMGELAMRARRDRAIAGIVREVDTTWHKMLTAVLRRAAREGAIDPSASPDELAALTIATLKGLFMLPRDDREQRAVDRQLRALENLIARRARAARSAR